ncbi:hypothetical protein I215_09221 [Galbibacter marinus]|uniref:Transposase n=1 Tax=Galbibacter marinus TaxID=555500 RepID=K2Q2D7_9FLAO|nr:hypothetical protein [Galbibacter marinus]EKF55031.1 hypothetical protein I215_09221 [Galbibacter marinus]
MSKGEKMFTFVEDFRASGLTGKAFCQTQGIVTSTLYYWIKKFDESSSLRSDQAAIFHKENHRSKIP